MPLFTVPNSYGTPLQEFNSQHEPGGSAIGGQFAKKSGTADPSHQLPAHESSLGSGEVLSSEALGGGVNVTMLVDIEDSNGETTQAVYKPEVGEVWDGQFANDEITDYVTNRDFSLAEREAAAYEVDQILGTDVVPETVHRAEVEEDRYHPDTDAVQEEYAAYREKAQEQAYDAVSEEMQRLYDEAKTEFVQDTERRADEITSIWNEVVEAHPESETSMTDIYGSGIDDHPLLQGLEHGRISKRSGKEADPLDIIDNANVEVTSKLTHTERENVRAVITRMITEEGYDTLADLDSDAAGEKFDEYGDWVGDHGDTEGKLIDDQISSFTNWKEQQGYASDNSSGGSRRNDQAPHPKGGSLQRFVKSGWGSPNQEQHNRLAVLDYAIGTMDRHIGNVILGTDNRVYAIDNGYSFPSFKDARLRAPAKRALKETGLPEPQRQSLQGNLSRANWAAFFARHPSMSDNEKDAFMSRIGRLKTALSTPDGLYALWQKTKAPGGGW